MNARALEVAIAHGDTAEVGSLIDAEPHLLEIEFPENGGLTPLMWACRNRHTTIVELLLSKGASVDRTNFIADNGDGGNSALWFAAQGSFPGTVPIARLLLDYGADINRPGELGTTPFFMAVTWVHVELVQFLLLRGAHPFAEDAKGRAPLQAVREAYEWVQTQKSQTEDMQRLGFRAPRLIAFLEKLQKS